ncbi:MAG TPA: exosortase/archaeosortase family protein [Cellvibrionaceae bacterium]
MRRLNLAPQHLFVLIIIPVIAGLYWPTLGVLAGRWVEWDKGLSHGILVATVFLWLLWKRPCPSSPRKHFALRAAALGAGSTLWFLLQSVQITVLAEAALLLVITLAYTAWLGFVQAWRYKAILLLPLFATSVWGELNSTATVLSGFVVGQMVELAGITAHIDGTTISLPYGQIVIAEGCSGLRYIVIALALGHMLACLNYYPARGYWATMAVALALGMITNWVRIFILVLVGYYSQMQNSLVSDHETFGWLLFAGVIVPPLYFAPVRSAVRTSTQLFSLPLSHLLTILLVLSLGPIMLALSLRPPVPSAWLEPLRIQASAPPAWAIAPPMPQAGTVEQGWSDDSWVQRWQYQRTATKDKLVPFIQGNWHPDIACTSKQIDELGAWFECGAGERPVLVLRRFDVGRFNTADFRRAKLWQLPAQWMGDNLFSLTQWQQQCATANNCEQAAAHIAALATGQQ